MGAVEKDGSASPARVAGEQTLEDPSNPEEIRADDSAFSGPGLLLVYTMGKPTFAVLPLKNGQLELGRGDGSSPMPMDPRMSRRHARVSYDGHRFHIEDLGSQNGSFVDGAALSAKLSSESAQVLRTGESLFLLQSDLRPYASAKVTVSDGRVVGPILHQTLHRLACSARIETTLHIIGETGVGKEVAARAFHASGSSGGPFVAVNCATIPEGVAERVLFGAKRGAFSGAATDSDGYLQAADGGTLFLDEIVELSLAVQAKLLRVLETREVYQLGATQSRPVRIRLCSATNKDLRAEVAAGRFREDLFFRLGSPAIEIPPLRKRREEIPWLIAQALQDMGGGLGLRTSLVEACLTRFWPGNIRELLTAVRAAAPQALAMNQQALDARHLAPSAGLSFTTTPVPDAGPQRTAKPSREAIESALQQTHGNVSAAARLLNQHRNQLQRLIDRLAIEPGRFSPGAVESDE